MSSANRVLTGAASLRESGAVLDDSVPEPRFKRAATGASSSAAASSDVAEGLRQDHGPHHGMISDAAAPVINAATVRSHLSMPRTDHPSEEAHAVETVGVLAAGFKAFLESQAREAAGARPPEGGGPLLLDHPNWVLMMNDVYVRGSRSPFYSCLTRISRNLGANFASLLDISVEQSREFTNLMGRLRSPEAFAAVTRPRWGGAAARGADTIVARALAIAREICDSDGDAEVRSAAGDPEGDACDGAGDALLLFSLFAVHDCLSHQNVSVSDAFATRSSAKRALGRDARTETPGVLHGLFTPSSWVSARFEVRMRDYYAAGVELRRLLADAGRPGPAADYDAADEAKSKNLGAMRSDLAERFIYGSEFEFAPSVHGNSALLRLLLAVKVEAGAEGLAVSWRYPHLHNILESLSKTERVAEARRITSGLLVSARLMTSVMAQADVLTGRESVSAILDHGGLAAAENHALDPERAAYVLPVFDDERSRPPGAQWRLHAFPGIEGLDVLRKRLSADLLTGKPTRYRATLRAIRGLIAEYLLSRGDPLYEAFTAAQRAADVHRRLGVRDRSVLLQRFKLLRVLKYVHLTRRDKRIATLVVGREPLAAAPAPAERKRDEVVAGREPPAAPAERKLDVVVDAAFWRRDGPYRAFVDDLIEPSVLHVNNDNIAAVMQLAPVPVDNSGAFNFEAIDYRQVSPQVIYALDRRMRADEGAGRDGAAAEQASAALRDQLAMRTTTRDILFRSMLFHALFEHDEITRVLITTSCILQAVGARLVVASVPGEDEPVEAITLVKSDGAQFVPSQAFADLVATGAQSSRNIVVALRPYASLADPGEENPLYYKALCRLFRGARLSAFNAAGGPSHPWIERATENGVLIPRLALDFNAGASWPSEVETDEVDFKGRRRRATHHGLTTPAALARTLALIARALNEAGLAVPERFDVHRIARIMVDRARENSAEWRSDCEVYNKLLACSVRYVMNYNGSRPLIVQGRRAPAYTWLVGSEHATFLRFLRSRETTLLRLAKQRAVPVGPARGRDRFATVVVHHPTIEGLVELHARAAERGARLAEGIAALTLADGAVPLAAAGPGVADPATLLPQLLAMGPRVSPFTQLIALHEYVRAVQRGVLAATPGRPLPPPATWTFPAIMFAEKNSVDFIRRGELQVVQNEQRQRGEHAARRAARGGAENELHLNEDDEETETDDDTLTEGSESIYDEDD